MSVSASSDVERVGRRPLGRTGRDVSELGLGCASYWARPGFPESRARAVFDTALACGITLFDTGGSYAGGEAERRLGRMLKASGVDPDDLVIATKAGTRSDDCNDKRNNKRNNNRNDNRNNNRNNNRGRIVRDFSPDGIVDQVHQSLERLGLERITLLQLHGPEPADLTDELLGALVRLRDEGKMEFVGINAHADTLEHAVGRAPFDVLMPFVSVVKSHNTGLAERAADAGQGVLAAEPLARMQFAPPLARWLTSGSGLWYLARALSQRADPALRHHDKCLRRALTAPDWSRAQLALAWVLARPGLSSAVFGTTRPENVLELVRACARPLPDSVTDAVAACHGRIHGDRA